ncbi:MAG: hypothetical protein F6K50_13010 [Moorea sp. SIO3I7]|uniref:hypothetical protein n=1 Tax=unclassified Moorena TaxID=2683338 RepID=UPI0013BF9FB2|nr:MULTISPECIES: hypothetical protein [unclassified Moorena]NEN96418.1 hypothetical protein [Moorena sp. SIO3I7]NEO06680.1 hypothetical protein [Moorena sp. SIO3I8]NEP24932.1 hypothetical protein [Moorena sp. SIO3I6]
MVGKAIGKRQEARGILLWNWHLASVMLIVGRASCCRTGILPVSCLLSGGQDAHSTDID